jgi:hypothetical protein
MAYPKSLDPVKTRGVSIPESLWECLKARAKEDQRTTSSFISILLFEAVNARREKVGLPAFADLEEMQAHAKETHPTPQKANPALPPRQTKAA